MALRIRSLAVAAPSIEQLCLKFAAKLKEAKPDALLWLTDSQQTAAVAKVASRACASIGARTDAGLIGGGNEFYGPPGDAARIAALAIQNAGAVTPFYSPPEGLPAVHKSTSESGARQFFTKSFLVDDAADLAPSSGEEPASPRRRAGVASTAWRATDDAAPSSWRRVDGVEVMIEPWRRRAATI